MKICIYGAGAVGGHLAARLAARGDATVSVIARGAHLAAIRDRGVILRTEGREIIGHPAVATDDPASLPPQDVVVVTLKAYARPQIVDPLIRLVAPDGVALFVANGVPWWWNARSSDGGALESVDPGGRLWNELGVARALGAIVSSSNAVAEPGAIVHTGSARRWAIGEPKGQVSERAQRIVDLLKNAGLEAVQTADIHREVVQKLSINVSANPIGALTLLSTRAASAVPGVDAVAIGLVDETLNVFAALGVDLRNEMSAEAIVRPPGGRGAIKSSMQQDVEAGRPLEVEAIVGQVQLFARETGIATPTIDIVLALLRGRDESLRLAREG